MINVIPLTDEEIITKIKKTISVNLPDSKIILFGSRTKNKATSKSDFDICIKNNEKISALLLYKIKEELDLLATLKKIDISDYHELSDSFKEQIFETGVKL